MARQFNSAGAHLGHRYFSSPIIIPDGTPEPPDDLSRVTQSTWPGSRAPHAWIGDGLSTLDWFGDGFVLYFIPRRKESAQLIEKECKEQCIPISLATSTLPNVQQLYEAPLVLVSPDGHVTWRGEMPPENITNLALKTAGQDIITNK